MAKWLGGCLLALLTACGQQPAGDDGAPTTPTVIEGRLEGDKVAGMPIYAGGPTPYADALIYESVVGQDGTFRFELKDSPAPNMAPECFDGTNVFAAWGTWGTPPEDSRFPGAFFTFAVLAGTTDKGQTVYVVWVYTEAPQNLPFDCADAEPRPGIELPAGWSTVLYAESPEGYLKRGNIPSNAEWVTRTLCFFQCQEP